jgi:hypothetical protein
MVALWLASLTHLPFVQASSFKLQVIIIFTYSFITRLNKHLLNIRMLAMSTKSININIITSFTTIASGGFGSFGRA